MNVEKIKHHKTISSILEYEDYKLIKQYLKINKIKASSFIREIFLALIGKDRNRRLLEVKIKWL